MKKYITNIETIEEEINKNIKEIKTIKRAIRNRKNKNKIYDELSLRLLELKNFIIHYENDKIVLRDRMTDFEELRNKLKLKIKCIKQTISLMEYNRVRCGICKIDIHRASYSSHLKSKKHLENMSQNKVTFPRKNPMKRVVKGVINVSDTKTENQ